MLSPYDRAYPPELRAAEIACIKQRRHEAATAAFQPIDPDIPVAPEDLADLRLPPDTVGLALSGGGIRSATFALGVLQALAARGLLRRIDFLSTVSGGGYIGAFFGALVQRRESIKPGGSVGMDRAEADLSDAASPPMQWLREHGRYMSPNGAGDEITAAGVYLRNVVAIHVVMATMVIAVLAAAALLRASVDERWPDALPVWDLGMIWWSPYVVLPIAVTAFIVFPLGWAYWFIQREKNRQVSDYIAAPTAGVVSLVSWVVAWRSPSHGVVFGGALFMGVTSVLALLAWQLGLARARAQAGMDVEGSARSNLSQWFATSLVVAVALAAFTLIDSLGQTLYVWVVAGSSLSSFRGAGVMGAFVALLTAVGKLAPILGDSSKDKRLSLPRSLVAGVAALVVVGSLLVSLSAITQLVAWKGAAPVLSASSPIATVSTAARAATRMDSRALAWLALAAFLLSAAFGRTLRFVNNSSYQALYGNRLTRAYLGASNRHRFIDKTGRRLSDPIRGDNIGWGEYAPFRAGGPLHIVNVTLNETISGQSQVEQRDRKGLSMAIGPCGLSGGLESHALWKQLSDESARPAAPWEERLPGTSTDWVKPIARMEPFHLFAGTALAQHEVEALSVGTWTAISGAAFSTGLGARTSLALSLLLGIANVRLGYWWDSHVDPRNREAVRTKPTLSQRVSGQLNIWLPVQTHLFQEFTARFFGPARRRWYLSDGGHFENTACYELIRRRVPFIIACDDGEDGGYIFEDLANLVRKARTDLCADIRFLTRSDIETLVQPSLHEVIGVFDDFRVAADTNNRAGLTQEFAKAHAVMAAVHYEGEADPGSLMLFIKPSVMGQERLDVLQYRQQHRAFPQEPTVDQFFDEAQWESYRALGDHIAARLFRPAEGAFAWAPSMMRKP